MFDLHPGNWKSRVLWFGFLTALFGASALADAPAKPPMNKTADSTPPKKLFIGKVVMLREALKRRGITAYEEFDKQVVLETPSGELIPIVPDWRGRAFYQDNRLRDRKVDLVGYRRKGVPYLQVLMVFVYNKQGRRQYMDYWCDICSIPMYEIKPCDCCQGPIRLRLQTRALPDYLTKRTDSPDDQPVPAEKP